MWVAALKPGGWLPTAAPRSQRCWFPCCRQAIHSELREAQLASWAEACCVGRGSRSRRAGFPAACCGRGLASSFLLLARLAAFRDASRSRNVGRSKSIRHIAFCWPVAALAFSSGKLLGMGRPCSICVHPERVRIDAEIVAGMAYRDISGRFQLSKSAVERHAGEHIPQLISRSRELREWLNADQLVGELRVLRETTLGILEESRTAGEHAVSLAAIARLEKQAELVARLLGELVERQRVETLDLHVSEKWVLIRSAIVDALAAYPEAQAAVLAALENAAE